MVAFYAVVALAGIWVIAVLGTWLGLGFVIGALFMFLLTGFWTRIILDKRSSQLMVFVWGVRGSSRNVYPLASIAKIRYIEATSYGRYPRTIRTICFLTDSGSELPFEDVVSDERQARKVAEFLNVPYEYTERPRLGDVLKAVGETLSKKQTS